MSVESGQRRPNPYNPSPRRLPRELADNSTLIPSPRPELPSDGRFAASTGEATVGFAMQAAEQPVPAVQNLAQHEPSDKRTQHGYL